MSKEAWELAENHITRHLSEEIADAYKELSEEIRGDGCGCIHCAHKAVDKLNGLIDMQFGKDEEQASFYKYKVVPLKTGFEVRELLDEE